MKINLLNCISVPESHRHIAGDFSDMFMDLFTKHDPGIEVKIFDVRAGHFPDLASPCDGTVCTGSFNSVYEPIPWIIALKVYVRELFLNGLKFVGYVLGTS
jgi:GMP synthase-like glutamine amidotransferase